MLTARVLPNIGGCIEMLDLTLSDQITRPVLVALSNPAAIRDARESAHFAMLPYVNRVRGNELRCDDNIISVPLNTEEPLALHGESWRPKFGEITL